MVPLSIATYLNVLLIAWSYLQYGINAIISSVGFISRLSTSTLKLFLVDFCEYISPNTTQTSLFFRNVFLIYAIGKLFFVTYYSLNIKKRPS